MVSGAIYTKSVILAVLMLRALLEVATFGVVCLELATSLMGVGSVLAATFT